MDDFDNEFLDDDLDEEDNDSEENEDEIMVEESRKDKSIWKSQVTQPKVGHCQYCGVEVIIDELPDDIARDGFEQFGACLNCQWGMFMDHGGHF